MNLLIDIGNTRLKWALQQSGQFTCTGSLYNINLTLQQLTGQWQHLPRPDHVAMACVNSANRITLVQQVISVLWPGCYCVVAQSQAEQCGVRSAYPIPEKLGVDRWLAIIAAFRHYRQAVCVMDFGTAITVDLVNNEGQHQGGFIAPGLTLMKQALNQNTARLGFSNQPYPPGFADNTEAAIFNGCLLTACGLVERSLSLCPKPCHLVLTGGDAPFVAEQLTCPYSIDEHLVLRGLELVAHC